MGGTVGKDSHLELLSSNKTSSRERTKRPEFYYLSQKFLQELYSFFERKSSVSFILDEKRETKQVLGYIRKSLQKNGFISKSGELIYQGENLESDIRREVLSNEDQESGNQECIFKRVADIIPYK